MIPGVLFGGLKSDWLRLYNLSRLHLGHEEPDHDQLESYGCGTASRARDVEIKIPRYFLVTVYRSSGAVISNWMAGIRLSSKG